MTFRVSLGHTFIHSSITASLRAVLPASELLQSDRETTSPLFILNTINGDNATLVIHIINVALGNHSSCAL